VSAITFLREQLVLALKRLSSEQPQTLEEVAESLSPFFIGIFVRQSEFDR